MSRETEGRGAQASRPPVKKETPPTPRRPHNAAALDAATIQERENLRREIARLNQEIQKLQEIRETERFRADNLRFQYDMLRHEKMWGSPNATTKSEPDPDPCTLISDKERENLAAKLREHYAAGRLAVEDYEARLSKVWQRPLFEKDTEDILEHLPPVNVAKSSYKQPEPEQVRAGELSDQVMRWRFTSTALIIALVVAVLLLILV